MFLRQPLVEMSATEVASYRLRDDEDLRHVFTATIRPGGV